MRCFKIHRSADKQFYFTIIGKNGRVLATSETYKRKSSAKKTIGAIVTLSLNQFSPNAVDNMDDKTL